MSLEDSRKQGHRWSRHEALLRAVLLGGDPGSNVDRSGGAAEALCDVLLREANATARRCGCRRPAEAAREAVSQWWSQTPQLRRTYREGRPAFPYACAALRYITIAVVAGRRPPPGTTACPGSEPVDPAPGPAALLERRELSERVRRAVGRLPERVRQALCLRVYDGLSSGEVAGRMAVAPATVHLWTHRALARLRRDLGADAGGGAQRPVVPSPRVRRRSLS